MLRPEDMSKGDPKDSKSFQETSLPVDGKVEFYLEQIRRGVVEIYSEPDLVVKLTKSIETDCPLRVKLGCDPSSPDLHLGHAVVLRKMRQFQDMGHKVLLIVGDFTATIGDPTGRSKTRPPLTIEQTQANGKTYFEQVTKILDPSPNKLELVYNSEWLSKMNFAQVLQLAQCYTVARMMERDDFKNRFESGVSISLHEFLYPLIQGYDSIALKSDIEIGGTDQTFNCLVGRDIQGKYGSEPQVVITMPLLVGLDGQQKMSKSLGNHIGLTDSPEVMYQKLMRIPDDLLSHYLELCTALNPELVKKDTEANPYEMHRILAREVVKIYHGQESIERAEQNYTSIAKGARPSKIQVVKISHADLDNGQVVVCRLATLAGLTRSNGEARRLILNNGLSLNNQKVTDPTLSVEIQADSEVILKKGKDIFVKIELS